MVDTGASRGPRAAGGAEPGRGALAGAATEAGASRCGSAGSTGAGAGDHQLGRPGTRRRSLPAVAVGGVTFVQRFGGLATSTCTSTSWSRMACSPTTRARRCRSWRCVGRATMTSYRYSGASSTASSAASYASSSATTTWTTRGPRRPQTLWGALQDEALATWRVPGRRTAGGGRRTSARVARGLSLHAAVGIAATDREGLKRLCRVGMWRRVAVGRKERERPPVSGRTAEGCGGVAREAW
jgi:hypothetical protein